MQESHPRAGWWPERLAALLALGGVIAASLAGYNVRGWQDAGSDFKTLYAAALCFLQGRSPYDYGNLAAVFHRFGIVTPASWYAHSPIYPPFTLSALTPFTAMPMEQAVYAWLGISTLALVGAIWAIAESCDRSFGLGRAWRLVPIVLVAVSPLVSFGLQVGNVSMVTAPLCIAAILLVRPGARVWRAAALAAAFVLKPHMALWVMVGLLLSRDREDRTVALRSVSYAIVAVVCLLAAFSYHHQLGQQVAELGRMMHVEQTTGSLKPENHELLPIFAQITSLQSLFGYFLSGWQLSVSDWGMLAILAACLLFLSRLPELARSDVESRERRLELLAAWSTFGLLATYHRTHDAVLLFALLPWLLSRLRRRWMDAWAWSAFVLTALIGVSFDLPTWDGFVRPLAENSSARGLVQFGLFRQASCATFLLMLLFLADLWRQSRVPAAAETGESLQQDEARKLVLAR